MTNVSLLELVSLVIEVVTLYWAMDLLTQISCSDYVAINGREIC